MNTFLQVSDLAAHNKTEMKINMKDFPHYLNGFLCSHSPASVGWNNGVNVLNLKIPVWKVELQCLQDDLRTGDRASALA